MPTLTLPQARRIAWSAQGFGRPRPAAVGARQVQRVIDQVAQFQIDSVNVVARAHYLPLFSRLGPYDPALLDAAFGRPPRRLFEYWGHEASLIDVRLEPALRWRMAGRHPWGRVRRLLAERPELVDEVYAQVAARPRGLTARALDDGAARVRTHWGWNWTDAKTACEWLFHTGRVLALRRTPSFERVYATRERVLPAAILAAPTPSEADAHVELCRRSLRALGVADAASVGDYFRVRRAPAEAALERLVAAGEAERVSIAGVPGSYYLAADAARPRAVRMAALLSPFDSALFLRPRLERLFGFDYRIEIYVPAHLRRYGYYVYPFVLDGAFAARVDLKADRAAGVLRVAASWLEPDADASVVAPALAAELRTLAGWLGLADVVVADAGDLAGRLRGAVG